MEISVYFQVNYIYFYYAHSFLHTQCHDEKNIFRIEKQVAYTFLGILHASLVGSAPALTLTLNAIGIYTTDPASVFLVLLAMVTGSSFIGILGLRQVLILVLV